MKKRLLPFILLFLALHSNKILKAQCYGVVTLDTAVTAGSNGFPRYGVTTFDIPTASDSELIMISYNGWNGPGSGPVTVDGNSATYVKDAISGNSGCADVYAYVAPSSGTHTIVCSPSGYNGGYYNNFAAAFYCSGGLTALTIASLTTSTVTIVCTTGGSITGNITTSVPNSAIYCSSEINEGQTGTYAISWTGATFLGDTHTEDGIDASQAYESAPCTNTFTITATNSSPPNNGCGGLTLVLVDIPPTLSNGPCGSGGLTASSNYTVPTCGNCNGSIGVAVSGGTAPYVYTWNPHVSSTDTATGLCGGTYTCTITDASCPVLDTTIIVTLPNNTAVYAAAHVITNEKCNGDCIGSAAASASGGTSPYTYQWLPGGQTYDTATGLCAGSYTINVTDNGGCTGTTTITITAPSLVTDTAIPANILCYGGMGSATVTASGGNSPYTYLWTPSNQTAATATGLIAGSYTVTVKDNNGCTASASTAVTQPARVTASISATNNILCNGGTGTATAAGSGGVSPYNYIWSPAGGNNATGTGLTVGSYTVTVTDHNGCTATAAITITQPPEISDTVTFIHATCNLANGRATVTVNGGGTSPYTYLWMPSAQTTSLATGLSAGSYTVTITDNNHCSTSATVDVTQPSAVTANITSTRGVSCYNGGNGSATVTAGGGTTPYTYLWTPGGSTSSTATGLFALGYTVTVTDANGCTTSTNTTITEPTQVVVSITEPKIICKDSTGTLIANASGGTTPYKYTWSTGATSTSNNVSITPISTAYYTVTVTDANGCTASNSITLQYGPSFVVNITGKNSVCAGDSTTICANAVGAMGGAKYVWEPENTTNTCITVIPGAASVYTVKVVDGCGETTTVATTVYTVPSPVINISANIVEGCTPLCIQFKNNTTITEGGIRQYLWNFGLIPGEKDTSFAKNPEYCYNSAGTYNVTLTAISDSGCSATYKKIGMINVYSSPRALFTYSPQPVTILNPAVQFMDNSRDAYGIAYRWWDFGEPGDTVSNLENPSHIYQDTGEYCVKLVVMNDRGCTDTTINCLVVEPAFTLYIPSAFTPNGDGMNDVFTPKGKYIKNYEMYIFDRWGLQLYHTTDINAGWNGKVNGNIVQEDTYIYKITVTDSKDAEHFYVGNVTVMK